MHLICKYYHIPSLSARVLLYISFGVLVANRIVRLFQEL